MNPKPGEVWLADLGLAAKTRPVIVVSRLDPNPLRSLIIYVPLTTQNRHSLYEIEMSHLHFLDKKTVANIQGLGSIPVVRLERKTGNLPDSVMKDIKKAILYALDFGFSGLKKRLDKEDLEQRGIDFY